MTGLSGRITPDCFKTMVRQTAMDLSGLEGGKALVVKLDARSRISVKSQVGRAEGLGEARTRGHFIDAGRSYALRLALGNGFSGSLRPWDGMGGCQGQKKRNVWHEE